VGNSVGTGVDFSFGSKVGTGVFLAVGRNVKSLTEYSVGAGIADCKTSRRDGAFVGIFIGSDLRSGKVSITVGDPPGLRVSMSTGISENASEESVANCFGIIVV
jgi:hypothetical protein